MTGSPLYESAAGDGDGLDQEFTELYQKHAAALLRYASLFAPAGGTAADAVQETFLRYFISRKSGRTIANPTGWCYEVMRHYLLGRLKRARSSEVGDGVLELLPARTSDPETQLVESEATRSLVERLTTRELECVTLRAGGLSYREIAEAMAIRPGTVGAVLARVQKKLRPQG